MGQERPDATPRTIHDELHATGQANHIHPHDDNRRRYETS
jgi:hypothetical protein